MSSKLSCFVIAPIGEMGSDIRKDSDDLLDLIIKPSLEVFNIDVIRGDHRNESGQIDVDVIKLVQESDLCIVDLSQENINVYYELGRRDETGKPIILLKSTVSQSLPVDIATRRYIEFNLDDRRSIITSRDKIKEAVQSFIDSGMEKTKGTSLFSISEKIDRIERSLSRLMESHLDNGGITTNEVINQDDDPMTVFRVAILQRNIPMAESAMASLHYSMDETSFYDYVVEQAAMIGSRKAGQMLIDNTEKFMDSVSDLRMKMDYIGCLITFLNKSDQESKYLDFVEEVAMRIKNEDGDVPAEIYNQLNRLHYGIYLLTRNENNLINAISYLDKAIEMEPEVASYYYNLALCYSSKADDTDDSEEKNQILQNACELLRKVIKLDGEKYDEDHIVLACRLFRHTDNAEWLDYLDLLKKISPNRAILLKRELR